MFAKNATARISNNQTLVLTNVKNNTGYILKIDEIEIRKLMTITVNHKWRDEKQFHFATEKAKNVFLDVSPVFI